MAIEANARLDGGAPELQVTCSIRDLVDQRVTGAGGVGTARLGEASSVTVQCWIPATLVPGHR